MGETVGNRVVHACTPGDTQMICEAHALEIWPHGDCPGPGRPVEYDDYRKLLDLYREGGGMAFDWYQEKAAATAFYPRHIGLLYASLKLCGESGEFAEKLGKLLRDKNLMPPGEDLDPRRISNEDRKALVKELGDMLWYLADIARQLELPLSEVAKQNLEKLADRKERGVLGGSGDDR